MTERPYHIEAETLAELAKKTIDAIKTYGIKVKRRVGSWCLMKEGYQEMRELHGISLTLKNPLKRWCSRINAGVITETIDYLLGLNAGFTHLSPWKFYDQWRTVGMEMYPYTYGHRIHGGNPDDLDQFTEVVKLLRRNPSTRHANIVIWRPFDVLRDFVPCNVFFNFLIDDQGRLNMQTVCRSQDALRGLFLDCFAYTHYLEQVCLFTGLPMGTYTVHQLNVHLYERDLDKLNTEFANPEHPYDKSDCIPSFAEPLTDKVKRKIYYFEKKLYEDGKVDEKLLEGMPEYWRQLCQFIATEVLKLDADRFYYKYYDIRWTLQRRIETLRRRKQ